MSGSDRVCADSIEKYDEPVDLVRGKHEIRTGGSHVDEYPLQFVEVLCGDRLVGAEALQCKMALVRLEKCRALSRNRSKSMAVAITGILSTSISPSSSARSV